MTQLIYPAKITRGDDGFYLVTFVDIPFAATDGKTMAETVVNARDCLAEALATMMVHGEDIPEPSKPRSVKANVREMVPVPIDISLKIALYDITRERGFGPSALGRELGIDEKTARRMLDPYYSTKMKTMSDAIGHFGTQLVIGLQKAG